MALQLTLTALGIDTEILLWTLTINEHGAWAYESRAVEEAHGTLTRGDLAQLISLYEKVDWALETLNAPMSADDRTLFRLEVVTDEGERRLYQSSEAMNHRSWQFRDLFHFLRHNVATAGDPIGSATGVTQAEPPALHP
ncbi:MAG TPA: hypothetical protein VGK74_23280 [Symbiobacteriaceae bacterium]|jgi:hypothetical protein